MKTKDIEHVQVIKVSKLRRTLKWLGYELVETKRFLAIWFSKWYQFHIMSAGLPIVYPEFRSELEGCHKRSQGLVMVTVFAFLFSTDYFRFLNMTS